MKTLELEGMRLSNLNEVEVKNTHGGGWLDFVLGYVASEILEGFQRGLSTPCNEVKCC